MPSQQDLDRWIDSIEQDNLKEIDHLIESKVKFMRRKKQYRLVMMPLSTLISLVLVFTMLVNMNDAFYVYALNTPIINVLAKLVDGRKDILSAFDIGYVQVIDKKVEVGDYTLEIDSIISDSRTINVFYKVRFKGVLIETSGTESWAPFDCISAFSNDFTMGYQIRHYQSYQWAEFYLSDLNTFKPFIIQYSPYGVTSDLRGEVTIVVDPTKVVQPKIIELNKTVLVGDQKLVLKELEMGAFQSRLTYYSNPENEKIINLVSFKDFTIAMWRSSMEPQNYRYDGINIGQLNHQGSISIELSTASLLEKEFETINFDPKTGLFENLPNHLDLISVSVDGSWTEIVLETTQSVFYQGLMPISDNVGSDTTWHGAGPMENGKQRITIGLQILDDQIVTFQVLGGEQLSVLPDPIVIQIP